MPGEAGVHASGPERLLAEDAHRLGAGDQPRAADV
jgi:hypothetical protein